MIVGNESISYLPGFASVNSHISIATLQIIHDLLKVLSYDSSNPNMDV